MDETSRRRTAQIAYNEEHGITPKGVVKSIDQVRFITRVADARAERQEREAEQARRVAESPAAKYSAKDLEATIAQLEADMRQAAKDLDFEAAARLRDQLFELRAKKDGTGSGARRAGAPSLAALRGD